MNEIYWNLLPRIKSGNVYIWKQKNASKIDNKFLRVLQILCHMHFLSMETQPS